MKTARTPLTFDCQGSPLVGMVEVPEHCQARGVLTVVAGGPQYRAGVGRQLIYLARALTERGIPVMRFDYRGMGDSGGAFEGFQSIEQDLAAALGAFAKAVPGLKEVVLWGGCDAASGILINAWKFPVVTGVVLASPYVLAEQTRYQAVRLHYWDRVREKSFWLKLMRLQFDLPATAASFLRDLVFPAMKRRLGAVDSRTPDSAERPFQERMLEGLEKFEGRVLLVMSGRSIEAREFDEMVHGSKRWTRAVEKSLLTRVTLPDADQVFSNHESRVGLVRAGCEWLCSTRNEAT